MDSCIQVLMSAGSGKQLLGLKQLRLVEKASKKLIQFSFHEKCELRMLLILYFQVNFLLNFKM